MRLFNYVMKFTPLFQSCFVRTFSGFNIKISKNRARPMLLELQNNKCLMCNTKFSKYVPHEIHHIDHNRYNNTLCNFVALCSNCHGAHHRYGIDFPHEKYTQLLYGTNKTNS